MNPIRPILAVFLSALMIAPAGLAQTAGVYSDKPQVPTPGGTGFLNALTRAYRQADVAPINLANSGRLDSLVRGGKIYLSLDDTIALALENNLDIEMSRYTPQIAQTDFLRAKSGGLLRGVPTTVSQASGSALSQVTGGTGGNAGGSSSLSGGASGGGAGGTIITQTGVATPNLDPSFFIASQFGHSSAPQSNTVTTGLTALQFNSRFWQTGYSQSFLTGTSFNYVWTNQFVRSNNPVQDLNPNNTPNMGLQITQRLLQGWGLAVNNRNIRIAKNNLKVSDLVFEQQVMTTIAGVVNLYWDLVSFVEDVKVKQKALEVAQKFYEDNKKQVEIGTLAPIEIVRAEANVALAQQNLTNSETALLQQETIIKSALSRTGTASPSVADARIIPTDKLTQPTTAPTEKLTELIDTALKTRPDLAQTQINITNTKIGIAGSRSQLRPSLDMQANFQQNSLSGQVNDIPLNGIVPIHNADAFFVGGYGNALGQIFRRNFPNYSVGFQLSMPIRNRSAQADYIRDSLSLRQQELSQQKQLNDIRVSVQNSWIAVIQARARHDSALKARILQEQTLDAENKKYALGASTAFLVVQTQRDLAQAQADEVAALAAYSRARVTLDLQTAQILPKYNVQISEAKAGKSSRPIEPVKN